MLELEPARRLVAARLPQHVTWLLKGTPHDFDFRRAGSQLRTVQEDEVNVELEYEWTRLALFGEADFAEGGGATWLIGIHLDDRTVQGLDFEREGLPQFLLNSDIDAFVRTFLAFDEAIRLGRAPLGGLQRALRSLDARSSERSEWRSLTQYLAD